MEELLKYLECMEFEYAPIVKYLYEAVKSLEKEKETILDCVESLHEDLKDLKAEKGGK